MYDGFTCEGLVSRLSADSDLSQFEVQLFMYKKGRLYNHFGGYVVYVAT